MKSRLVKHFFGIRRSAIDLRSGDATLGRRLAKRIIPNARNAITSTNRFVHAVTDVYQYGRETIIDIELIDRRHRHDCEHRFLIPRQPLLKG